MSERVMCPCCGDIFPYSSRIQIANHMDAHHSGKRGEEAWSCLCGFSVPGVTYEAMLELASHIKNLTSEEVAAHRVMWQSEKAFK